MLFNASPGPYSQNRSDGDHMSSSVVVNHEPGAQHLSDGVQNGVSEVSDIGADDHDGPQAGNGGSPGLSEIMVIKPYGRHPTYRHNCTFTRR